jgi:hypothetical protein
MLRESCQEKTDLSFLSRHAVFSAVMISEKPNAPASATRVGCSCLSETVLRGHRGLESAEIPKKGCRPRLVHDEAVQGQYLSDAEVAHYRSRS